MKSYKNRVWNKLQTYKAKIEETEEMEPNTNIDFNEKGLITRNFKCLKELRDFFLDGTQIEIVERKVLTKIIIFFK